MSIRHSYERIVGLSERPPHDYLIALEDGTVITLPGTGFVNYRVLMEGDRVLIDFEVEHLTKAVVVSVRRGINEVTSFVVHRDYVSVPETAANDDSEPD